MKVLHVMNGPNWGGSYRFVSQLCERQRAQGVDAVVCYLEGGPSKDRVVQLGAPVLAYDPDRTYSSKRERWADLEKGYEKIVTEWQPDLINSHLSLSHLLTNRLYRRKLTPKWVALIHQSWKQYGFSHDVMKKPWKKHYLMMRHGLGCLDDPQGKQDYDCVGSCAAGLPESRNGQAPRHKRIQRNYSRRSEYSARSQSRVGNSQGSSCDRGIGLF